MMAHIRNFFPRQCGGMSADEFLDTITHGIAAAKRYGLTSKVDICKYVDFTIVLGRGFDDDPRMPWAREILSQEIESALKIDDLHQSAIEYLAAARA